MRNKKIIDNDSLLSMQEENIKKNAGKGGKRKKAAIATAVVLLVTASVAVPTAVYLSRRKVSVDISNNIDVIQEYTVNVNRGSTIKDIVPQEITGYTFVGFYKDAELTVPYNENYRLTKNTTLYAKYEINIYKILFPTSPAFTIEGEDIVNNQVEIEYNTEYRFKLNLNTGYDESDITVKVNGETVTPDQDGYYTLTIYGDTLVEVEGVEINTYEVTFHLGADAEDLLVKIVDYNEICVYDNDTPTKPSTHTYAYTFIGWVDAEGNEVDLSTTHIVSNLDLYPRFEEKYIEYTITKPEQVNVKFGDLYLSNTATLHYGDIVEITYDTTEGHDVTAFSVSGAEKVEGSENQYRITGNLVVTYSEEIQTFTVTWKNWDGSTLETDTSVPYGTTPEYNGETPTRDETASHSYTFTGWDQELSPVTGDITYTAQFVVYRTLPYEINENGEITNYIGTATRVEIPSTYSMLPDGTIVEGTQYAITGIADASSSSEGAFANKNITSITIPEGFEKIGAYAFDGCTGLTSITIPDSVTSIGHEAFSNCTSLTSVTIGESVTSIGSGAFYRCTSLTSITIPDSVTSIGNSAFCECSNLAKITISEGVTEIGGYTFYGCSDLREIVIPKSISSIGGYAFYNCISLYDITIPNNVIRIENYAFYNCRRLTNVRFLGNINDWVTKITFGNDMHGSANPLYTADNLYVNGDELVTDANIDTATYINPRAFRSYRALNSITLGKQVTRIGDSAFIFCNNLKDVYYAGDINDWVSKISGYGDILGGSSIDSGANLYVNGDQLVTNAVINSATRIGEGAFYGCKSIVSVTIGSQVTSMGRSAFCYCTNLKEITLAENLSTIGGNSFLGCCNLTNITIPASVTSIGTSAFSDCSSLVYVVNKSTLTFNVGDYDTSTSDNPILEIVSDESDMNLIEIDGNLYKNYNGERYFIKNLDGSSEIVIDSSCTQIYQFAFFGGDDITSVTIPEGVTSIGRNAFQNCSSLTSITIPSSVNSIEDMVFYRCRSLTSVTIESNYAYKSATGTSACGYLLQNVEEVRVLINCIGGSTNSYLENASRFTKTTSEDELYYIYTKI